MSEEKPVFKITDRRLFNPDGTPREGVREEEPESTATTQIVGEQQTAESSVVVSTPTETSAREQTREASTTHASASPAARDEPTRRASVSPTQGHEEMSADEMEGGDPTAFVNLVMFIASPAAAAMGMTEHPGMAGRDIDLPLAKHCIDLLATLRQKSESHLTAQEREILDSLLAELRMQFVSLTNARPGGAAGGIGGFTASDITGGR
jgi:hypothetical protein